MCFRIRGLLGSTVMLSWNVGLLVAFILGNFMYCMTTPYVYLALNMIFYVLFIRLPDTPVYYAKKGMMVEAERSLRFFRGLRIHESSEGYRADMEVMRRINRVTGDGSDEHRSQDKMKLKDFSKFIQD